MLLLGGGQLLAAVHADVAGMPGPALLAVDWEAQAHSSLSALLSWVRLSLRELANLSSSR